MMVENEFKVPFRGWATLPEAAECLSEALGNTVAQEDVLMLCLNGAIQPSVRFVEKVLLSPVVRVSKRELRVRITNPGYKLFHENPSWEPLDDEAKTAHEKMSILEIQEKLPDLYLAIQDGKYRTREVLSNKISKDEYMTVTGETFRSRPTPIRLSAEGNGRNWIRGLYETKMGYDQSWNRGANPLIVQNQDGTLLQVVEKRESIFNGGTKWIDEPYSLTEICELVFINRDLIGFMESYTASQIEKQKDEQGATQSQAVVIAVLLDLLKQCEKPRYNQSSIIQTITQDEAYRDVLGLSQSNLEKLFANANAALRDAKRDS